MFCPKCGSLLQIKRDGSKRLFVCSCGYKSSKIDEKPVIRDTVKADEKELEIIDNKAELEVMPKTDADCPKCHHQVAYYWLIQTRAGDEPETRFFKCEKCNHTWRDYS